MSVKTVKQSEKPLPFHLQFFAGGIAGVSEILTMYPLDTVKTRSQLSKTGSPPIIQTLKEIVKKEGFGRLYKGIAAPIFIEAPKRAIKFSANDQYKQLYADHFANKQLLSIATGVSAGCTEAFVVVPFELVKIRLQDKNTIYKNTQECIKAIYKTEGPLAFFNGLEATLWRHATWNGGYFGVIHSIKSILPEAETKEGDLFRNFIAGALGGTFGTMLNTPFDVVKSRIQNQKPGDKTYGWTLPGLVKVAKEEGPGALYKGFLPKVLRLGPGGGILLTVYAIMSDVLRPYA
eukprot:NODE_593_length_5604_cov_0.739691.p2 type:complete len:290 gc:universal NODE_593_length_5604_cov_0.739691:1239-2108(+)